MKKNLLKFLLVILVVNYFGCSKNNDTPSPNNNNGNGTIKNIITVTTTDVINIKTIRATINSKVVTEPATNSITAKGVVWSTLQNPTITLTTKTSDGSSTGTYQSQIADLQSNTKYFIRAYATDANGNTTYGNELSFNTNIGWRFIESDSWHSLGIKDDGTLWSWGNNLSGQLGNGTSINQNKPIQIGVDNDWKSVSSGGQPPIGNPEIGSHILAIKNDGTLWAWGSNIYGQLGDNTLNNRFIPVKISNDKWLKVYADGRSISTGIKSDGSVWIWGKIFVNRVLINQKTPKQIPAIGNFIDIVSDGLSSGLVLYIKNDGTLWEGNILSFEQLIQKQTESEKKWTKLYHKGGAFIGIASDESAWGKGDGVAFGNGTTGTYPSFVKISDDLGKISKSLSTSGYMTYIIKLDGTLWGTGRWVLGDGTPPGNRFTFTQVGTLNIWKSVSTGGNTFAIQTNGSLWVCGGSDSNAFGQLGLGESDINIQKLMFTLVD